jgi:predicted ATPase
MPITDKPQRYVITGTSGTGKTSLIEELKIAGFVCFEEPGRKVLTSGSDAAKTEPEPFIEEMLIQSLKDFEKAQNKQIAFYDRGLPDIVAYAHRFNVTPDQCQQAAETHLYESMVFVTPPWEEIFVNDEVRRATFKEYLQFHESILKIYFGLGYSVRVLPKSAIHERVEFIKTAISIA